MEASGVGVEVVAEGIPRLAEASRAPPASTPPAPRFEGFQRALGLAQGQRQVSRPPVPTDGPVCMTSGRPGQEVGFGQLDGVAATSLVREAPKAARS